MLGEFLSSAGFLECADREKGQGRNSEDLMSGDQ
jgi:hypothetical protein